MIEIESSSSRLAKPKKGEFTLVNDLFLGKRNEEIGLYRQTLIKGCWVHVISCYSAIESSKSI